MNTEEVENIIQEIKNGSDKGFDLLYDTYAPALYGVCLKIIKDAKVAEDVLQDSFSKIWSKIDSFDSAKGSFFTWQLNITRNTAIDYLRKQDKNPIFDNGLEEVESSKSTVFKTNHIGLDDIVDKLPENEKKIIIYLFYKGFTQQEVADELEIPLGTVKTRSRKALSLLKKMFSLLLL